MAQHTRPYPYAESLKNTQLMALYDRGPLFSDELPNGARFTPRSRPYVGSVQPTWGSGKSVWYLWGDERQAIRRFVKTYEDEVRDAMVSKNSALCARLDDALWRMLCEEFYWGVATDEEQKEIGARQRRVRSQATQNEIDAEAQDV